MKKILYIQGDVTYELGGGLGSWAKSVEKKVVKGTTRFIGEVLMYAYTVYPKGCFNKYEINWCPVDRDLCHDFDKLRSWKNNL